MCLRNSNVALPYHPANAEASKTMQTKHIPFTKPDSAHVLRPFYTADKLFPNLRPSPAYSSSSSFSPVPPNNPSILPVHHSSRVLRTLPAEFVSPTSTSEL